jgi:hypothetical protein
MLSLGGPGFTHELGFRPAGKQDGVLLGGDRRRRGDPRRADGVYARAAPGGVAEDGNEPHERRFIQR